MKFSISSLGKPLALTVAAGLIVALPACSGSPEFAAPAAPASGASSEAPASTAPSASPSESPSASATASSSPSTTSSASPTTSTDRNAALLAAGKLAGQDVSGGLVTSIESERNGWEVHVVSASGAEQQLRTNVEGVQLVSGPTDDRPDAEDRAENQEFAQVETDYRRAVQSIQGEIDDAQINDLSLDRENRRTVWEADVSVGAEQRTVQISAADGSVVSNRIDN